MSGREYIKNSVKIVEKEMVKRTGCGFSKRFKGPMDVNYRPEVDGTQFLDTDDITIYQSYIGILRWAVELGRLDILHEVSKLSSYNASPRIGHLEAVYRIFGYLKMHQNSRIVFDDKQIEISPGTFYYDPNWEDFYPDAEEETHPPKAPESRGPAVKLISYVDADHAGNVLTRRSHTGILHFINNAPINWYSKRQNTVESSTFGSEFNALRIAVDQTVSLRYKLRMMGVNIEGQTHIFCDNRSVVNNLIKPKSTLSKKHNQVCYHRVREAIAGKICSVSWIDGENNLTDLFTKSVNSTKRKKLLGCILW